MGNHCRPPLLDRNGVPPAHGLSLGFWGLTKLLATENI